MLGSRNYGRRRPRKKLTLFALHSIGLYCKIDSNCEWQWLTTLKVTIKLNEPSINTNLKTTFCCFSAKLFQLHCFLVEYFYPSFELCQVYWEFKAWKLVLECLAVLSRFCHETSSRLAMMFLSIIWKVIDSSLLYYHCITVGADAKNPKIKADNEYPDWLMTLIASVCVYVRII